MKTKMFQLAVVLVGGFLTCISVFADPLNNWHWRNPLPNGNPSTVAYNLYGVVFTNGQFFAVGTNGMEIVSSDGTNWIQWPTATTNTLYDIIYGNGEFIAVGTNGTVETSTTGTNWVLQNSGTTNSLGEVAYGNGKYVAVGESAIITSPDGVTWSPDTSGPSGASSVACSDSGFLAVDGGTNVYFSQNGLIWITNTAPGTSGGNRLSVSLVSFAKGTFWIGADRAPTSTDAGSLYVCTSSDGQKWTTNFSELYDGSASFSFFLSGNSYVIFGGYLPGGNTFILSSSDGVTWAQKEPGLGLVIDQGYAGTYGSGLYIIVRSTQIIYNSTDATNWVMVQPNIITTTGPTNTFNSITYSNGTYVVAASDLIVVSTNGLVYNVESNTPSLSSVTTFGSSFVGAGTNGAIYQSSDGITWTQRVSGTANNLHCVAGGGNQLVAVGDGGVILTSPDGTAWTSQTSHTVVPLFGVAYSNGLYVAVGGSGINVNSPDAINWTLKYSGHTNSLSSVTYGSAGFLAVGTAGIVLTSPDGVNWTQQNAGTSAALESASFGNGYYLVDGANALVMTSPDGVNWTTRNIGATGGQTLYGSAFLNGRFDVVGSGGTVMESDPVAPLLDLQMHTRPNQNVFTLFAMPGSTFRIVSSSDLFSGSWSTVATFNNAAAITLWTNNVSGDGTTYFRLVSP